LHQKLKKKLKLGFFSVFKNLKIWGFFQSHFPALHSAVYWCTHCSQILINLQLNSLTYSGDKLLGWLSSLQITASMCVFTLSVLLYQLLMYFYYFVVCFCNFTRLRFMAAHAWTYL